MKHKYFVFSTIIILLSVCIFLFMKIDNRLVLHIDDFTLDKATTNSISIGHDSDICYNQIPHDFINISVDDDSIRWNVNPDYYRRDSLCYYMINNQNPNKHELKKNDIISVEYSQNGVVDITYDEIVQLLSKCKSKYVLLRHIHAKRNNENGNDDSDDYFKAHLSKSFIFRPDKDNGRIYLVILDKYTKIIRDDCNISYVMRGSFYNNENIAKVQFFKISTSFYRKDKVDKESFYINGINYVSKPVIITTEWGAGHVSIRRTSNDKVKVYFQKPVTYVERIEDLKQMASLSSGVLTFRQKDDSFPIGNNLTLPTFSSAVSMDVCSVKISNDSLYCDEAFLPHECRWIPGFKKFSAGSTKSVSARVGFIDTYFLWTCLLWPLLIFTICLIGCQIVFNTKRLSQNLPNGLQFNRAALSLPTYSAAIFLILLVYSICRIMISVKLAYTFPFFEKVFAVAITDACLSIMLVYGITLLFNHTIISADSRKVVTNGFATKTKDVIAKRIQPWKGYIIYIIGLALCILLFAKMNSSYSNSVLQSYLEEDVNRHGNISWNFLKWNSRLGMNDLLFNVPYMLLLVNIFVFCLGCIVVFYDLMTKKRKNWDNFIQTNIFFTYLEEKVSRAKTPWGYFGRFILWYAFIPSAIIAALSIFPLGNFATAIVSVILIFALCWTISHIDYNKCGNFWRVMLLSIIVAILYLAGAVCGGKDMGYITNSIGIFLFVAVVFCLANKSSKVDNRKWWMIVAPLLLVYVGIWVGAFILSSPDDVNYDRLNRRNNLMVNYKKYVESGYRYVETDAEFMRVMKHYMLFNNYPDPLSNEDHILHMSISNGQSPVILNDVSIQSCFFSAYGWLTYIVYFELMLVMALIVWDSVYYIRGEIGQWTLRRLLAMLMWVGTSIYLILSYVGLLPFTGRLNPGFGVDSVGEVLESAFLLAFILSAKLVEDNGANQTNVLRPTAFNNANNSNKKKKFELITHEK